MQMTSDSSFVTVCGSSFDLPSLAAFFCGLTINMGALYQSTGVDSRKIEEN